MPGRHSAPEVSIVPTNGAPGVSSWLVLMRILPFVSG